MREESQAVRADWPQGYVRSAARDEYPPHQAAKRAGAAAASVTETRRFLADPLSRVP
jgi:hypothetical protein